MENSVETIPTLIERFYHWEKTTPNEVFLRQPKGEKCGKSVAQSIKNSIEEVNSSRANFERISTAIIQQDPWSVENDLITPTLKVRRGKIDDTFSKDYLSWHEADEAVIWA